MVDCITPATTGRERNLVKQKFGLDDAVSVVCEPFRQRATGRAEFNAYVYDLAEKAQDRRIDLTIDESTVRPTGHWWHSDGAAAVTSSIDIAAARAGVRYISAHEILGSRVTDLSIPVGKSRQAPDQLLVLL